MADDKLKAGPESPGEGSVGDAQTVTKPPVPETVEEPAAGTGPVRQPEQSVTPGMGGDVPAQPAPQVEADKVEKSPDQDKKVEPEEKTAKRRGRPPKAVSYTHLDVYKRQVQRGGCRADHTVANAQFIQNVQRSKFEDCNALRVKGYFHVH